MPNHAESALEVRLDKWLWAARFYKTRSIARDQIDGGKVHYNGQRSKPGKQVEVGALIRFWQGQDEREVRVLALSEQRKSAPLAQQLYEETAESLKNGPRTARRAASTASLPPAPSAAPTSRSDASCSRSNSTDRPDLIPGWHQPQSARFTSPKSQEYMMSNQESAVSLSV